MKKLRRYPDDGVIGGVCEGLGKYLNIEPSILRIIWILLILGLGIGIIPYIIAWICIPEGKDEHKDL